MKSENFDWFSGCLFFRHVFVDLLNVKMHKINFQFGFFPNEKKADERERVKPKQIRSWGLMPLSKINNKTQKIPWKRMKKYSHI